MGMGGMFKNPAMGKSGIRKPLLGQPAVPSVPQVPVAPVNNQLLRKQTNPAFALGRKRLAMSLIRPY